MVLHPALAHLSQSEIDELIAGYMSGTRAFLLFQQFRIDASHSQIRRILPPQILSQACTLCGAPMCQAMPRRENKKLIPSKVMCSVCSHEESGKCACPDCKERQNRFAIEAKARIQAELSHAIIAARSHYQARDIDLNALSLNQAVAFLALIRCGSITDKELCGPLSSNSLPFAPTSTSTDEWLETLISGGIVAVSEHSTIGTIEIDHEKIVYDSQKVQWLVLIKNWHELIQQIEHAGLTKAWPTHWYEHAEQVWKNLALSECRQFYDYSLQKRGFRANGDIAINHMLMNVLRDFSVAQTYAIIWTGARDAADFFVRGRLSRVHVANYMVGACQRYADRARTEAWQVSSFKRNFDLPRSMISYVLFDVIFKIGERGFENTVSMKYLAASMSQLEISR